jgi:hypothetical protein
MVACDSVTLALPAPLSTAKFVDGVLSTLVNVPPTKTVESVAEVRAGLT